MASQWTLFKAQHLVPIHGARASTLPYQLVARDEQMEGSVLLVEKFLVPVLPNDLPLHGAPPIRQHLHVQCDIGTCMHDISKIHNFKWKGIKHSLAQTNMYNYGRKCTIAAFQHAHTQRSVLYPRAQSTLAGQFYGEYIMTVACMVHIGTRT